ncbi:RSP_7527 family protein [Celeribacter sp.]|uniref:RSP_7527 family protein n=1 Tax=Celeribacter sp. TaxID=1890673 RepID=UPI003A951DC4
MDDYNAETLFEIEERARKLRAEAARDLVASFGGWVKARFSHGRVASKGKLA